VTNATAGARVGSRLTEGELDVTTSKPAAQQLREILDGDSGRPFEGSGCSDHVRRRNLRVSVAGAVLLLIVLLALLVL
jgi:hypothetical protein